MNVLYALLILVFLYLVVQLLSLPFRLYRSMRIKQVLRDGKELVLQGQASQSQSRGRYGVIVYEERLSFSHYDFVSDNNPYGIVRALNSSKIGLSAAKEYENGTYHIKYRKRGRTIDLVVLDFIDEITP